MSGNVKLFGIPVAKVTEAEAVERTLECFRGYADCVEGAKEMGVIRGTGVYEPGKVKNTPAFGQAYEMGRSVR